MQKTYILMKSQSSRDNVDHASVAKTESSSVKTHCAMTSKILWRAAAAGASTIRRLGIPYATAQSDNSLSRAPKTIASLCSLEVGKYHKCREKICILIGKTDRTLPISRMNLHSLFFSSSSLNAIKVLARWDMWLALVGQEHWAARCQNANSAVSTQTCRSFGTRTAFATRSAHEVPADPAFSSSATTSSSSGRDARSSLQIDRLTSCPAKKMSSWPTPSTSSFPLTTTIEST